MHYSDVPLWNRLLQLAAVSTSVVAAVLNARQDVRGFHLWIVSNSVLFAVHIQSQLWVVCVSDMVYTRICASDIRSWRARDVGPALVINNEV